MILFHLVDNFLELLILLNRFLNYGGCVYGLNNLLRNCGLLFLCYLNCFLGNYCYIISLFINKSHYDCVLLRFFRISCDDSCLHCIIRSFCNCWNYLAIFRQCLRFHNCSYYTLDGLRILDNFHIICNSCLKSWNCIDCILSFAW